MTQLTMETQHPAPVHPGDRTPGDILLEAGTNEFEVLVFQLEGGWFGINVAKVREVILPVKATESPNQPRSVIGMFNIRGQVLPLIDLKGHLGIVASSDDQSQGRIIVTEFNGRRASFLVDRVEQIHRISWAEVKPAPELDEHGECGSVTGTIDFDGRLVLLLDFESVTDEICMQEQLHVEYVENTTDIDRGSKLVILAEDSAFVRRMIREVFRSSGYDKLRIFPDGLEAWKAILGCKERGETIDAVVTDIEMPRIDGLNLTRRIKADPDLSGVPVMLFSSLITADNLKKGRQVGADAQVAKPDLPQMVELVDRLLAGLPIENASLA